jgi:hypothetical protein
MIPLGRRASLEKDHSFAERAWHSPGFIPLQGELKRETKLKKPRHRARGFFMPEIRIKTPRVLASLDSTDAELNLSRLFDKTGLTYSSTA